VVGFLPLMPEQRMRSLKMLVPKTRYNKSQFLMVDNIEFIGLGIHVNF
jgi:hypothetical protein